MSTSPSKTASDAIATLDKIASAPDAAEESRCEVLDNLCKQAEFDDGDRDYIEKFAARFEEVTALSTEELVKHALRKFKPKSKADAVLTGICRETDKDNVKCAAALNIIGEQDVRNDPRDAALLSALEKAARLGSAFKALAGPAAGAAGQASRATAGGGAGSLAKTLLPGLAVGGAGMGAYEGGKHLYQNYGAPAGQRRMLEQFGPTIAQNASRRGDISSIIQMMRGMKGNIDPQWLDILERASSFRRNPWVPNHWS